MPSLREIKARARRDLHVGMKVPAFYFMPKSLVAIPVDVRVHTKIQALGDVKGTSFAYAEQKETVPKLIFWRENDEPAIRGMDPVNHAAVVVSREEGYTIDTVDPRDFQTTTTYVRLMTPKELARFPAPEDGTPAYLDAVLPAMVGHLDPGPGDMPALEMSGEGFAYMLAAGDLVLPEMG